MGRVVCQVQEERAVVLRRFVEEYLPEARFSDSRVCAEVASCLDESAAHYIKREQRLSNFVGEHGYGFCLAYIPYVEGRPYNSILKRAKSAARMDWRLAYGQMRAAGKKIKKELRLRLKSQLRR